MGKTWINVFYTGCGYSDVFPKVKSVTLCTILIFTGILGEDLGRLIGQFVYSSRYDLKTWEK